MKLPNISMFKTKVLNPNSVLRKQTIVDRNYYFKGTFKHTHWNNLIIIYWNNGTINLGLLADSDNSLVHIIEPDSEIIKSINKYIK